MDETNETNSVTVSFLEGKFGKQILVVDSFIFYPKDKDKVRLAWKTRGCNVTITVIEERPGLRVAHVNGKHNHPNHQRAIENNA